MKRSHVVLLVLVTSLVLLSGLGLAQGEAYVLRLVKFYCGDESGNDNLGSDEIYWVFTARDPNGTTHTVRSREWGDIDSENTREFATEDDRDVVWPKHRAAKGAPGPIELFVQAWEADIGGEADRAVEVTRAAFKAAEDIPGVGDFIELAPDIFRNEIGEIIGDDSMGTQTIVYSTDELASQLPQVGDSFTDDYHFEEPDTAVGGPADYDLFIEVTRVQ